MPDQPPISRLPWDKKGRDKRHAKEYDRQRGTAAQRGYDSRWKKVRDRYIKQHPLCAHCKAEGIIEAAVEVDHILPVKQRPDLRLNPQNLQSLCKAHHRKKTLQDMQAGGGV